MMPRCHEASPSLTPTPPLPAHLGFSTCSVLSLTCPPARPLLQPQVGVLEEEVETLVEDVEELVRMRSTPIGALSVPRSGSVKPHDLTGS